ncbi:hypothetical protein B484DRAFT_145719 [Ochromonadaceae sp. CCMP2298]|nr:hypothetical protein B484DRAFT_145719 [Ochromonadaceae sp. CCMP2298]
MHIMQGGMGQAGALRRMQEKLAQAGVELLLKGADIGTGGMGADVGGGAGSGAGAGGELYMHGPSAVIAAAQYDLLDMLKSLFPSQVVLEEVPKPSLTAFGVGFSDQVGALAGVLVKVDKHCGVIFLNGDGGEGQGGGLGQAREIVGRVLAKWEELHASVTVEKALVSLIVGKAGANINAMRKETNCEINITDIDPLKTLITLRGASKKTVQAARVLLEERVGQLRAQVIFILLYYYTRSPLYNLAKPATLTKLLNPPYT